jgi:hypothetical protein
MYSILLLRALMRLKQQRAQLQCVIPLQVARSKELKAYTRDGGVFYYVVGAPCLVSRWTTRLKDES